METRLQRDPVYQQLNQRLRGALARDYRRGDRFLTEREIAERFEVSRPTANKVLAGLVSEGLLEFRRGVGTFVRCDVIDYDVRSLVSFTEKARAAGMKPATNLVAFQKIDGTQLPETVASQLGGAEETCWRVERVRLADSVPVILEQRFVVARHCPGLTRRQAAGSLYHAWTEIHKLQIAGADEVIRAVTLNREESRRLETSSRAPALEVTAVGFLKDQSPLWWERTLYRGDRYEFHTRLGPIQSGTPARGKLRGSEISLPASGQMS